MVNDDDLKLFKREFGLKKITWFSLGVPTLSEVIRSMYLIVECGQAINSIGQAAKEASTAFEGFNDAFRDSGFKEINERKGKDGDC